MPRDATTGVYTVPPGTPGVTGAPISSSAYNGFLTDISQAVTQSVATTGQTPMTAPLNMNGNTIQNLGAPVNPTDAAPLSFITGKESRIINGNFAINQRAYVSGTALAAAVYGHDRWKAGASGCTYTFTAALPDTTITITAGTLTQVVEAGMIEGGVYTLSWTGTAQARVYQGTPTGSYAASPVTTSSLTAGTNTIVEFNAGTLVRAKLEIGSVATPFNRKTMAESLADCQRYYIFGNFNGAGYGGIVGAFVRWSWAYPTTMRAIPSFAFGFSNNTNVASPTGGLSADAGSIGGTTVAAGNWVLAGTYTASAEL